MTTTAPPPAPPTSAPPPAEPAAPPARPVANRLAATGLIRAELALTVVSLVVALGLGRLFADTTWQADVVVAVVASHALAAIGRRAGWNLLLAALLSAAGLVVVVAWLRYSDTLTWALPTGTTWDAVSADLREAWSQFGHVKAPAEVLPGFVVAAIAALWVFAFAADTAAFRVGVSFEALVPAGVVFVFTSMLADERWRVGATVAFLAACLFFVLAHRLSRRPPSGRAAEQTRIMLSIGGTLVVFAALVGAALGPALPGAEDDPLVNWKDLDGGSSGGARIALSPLVDIRGRLVDQAPVEVFTVVADAPAYWRTTALDTFDGSIWGFRGNYEDASGSLDPPPLPEDVELNEQSYTMAALSGLWLPTAYAPVAVTFGRGIRYDVVSATLITEGQRTRPGDEYVVTSATPRYTPEMLRAAPPETDATFVQRFTELPADFSPGARALAEEITVGQPTEYDMVRTLQDWFVDNFTYDIDVASGHDNNRTDAFLADRRGYCEQFAGTFAAMARHLGIPARVAVGFTPGELVGENTWQVRGEHYHAWPEVWFSGIGWVPFEPTPGRGAPFAEDYTGRPVQQAVTGEPNESDVLDEVPPATPGIPGAGAIPEVPPGGFVDPGAGIDTGSGGGTGADSGPDWFARSAVVLLVLAIGFGLWSVVVPALRHRLRRRRRTVGPPVSAAWQDMEESLALAGVHRHETETRSEFASRAASVASLSRRSMLEVAAGADAEGFADPPVTDQERAERAARVVSEIEAILAERGSPTARFLRRIDPRPLVTSWNRPRPGSP